MPKKTKIIMIFIYYIVKKNKNNHDIYLLYY